MKKYGLSLLLLIFLMPTSNLIFAQDSGDVSYPTVSWISKSGSDMVTIENGTGASLNIVINVANDGSSDPAGVNVQNCGDTTHIDASSSAICVTSDANYPVTFSSDKNKPATGTYEIKQRMPNQPLVIQ